MSEHQANCYPQPSEGWSRSFRVVKNAILTPPEVFGGFPVCGVYGPDGDEPFAAHWREDKLISRPVLDPPTPVEHLSGTHVFGAFLYGHFGHFMLEATTRLWMTDIEKPESYLFMPRRDVLSEIRGWHKEVYDILIPDIPTRLVSKPVSVETLIIPGQGFGLGTIVEGTPEFRFMLRKRIEEVPADGPEKVYISRSRNPNFASVLNENVLEENLKAQGYAILYPEKMTILEQLSWYKSATHVVGTDCSALHLFGFAANPDKNVSIILRRNTNDYVHIARQIKAMIGRSPEVINSLTHQWVQDLTKDGNHKSYGEIDFQETGLRLKEAGLVDDLNRWRCPSAEEQEVSVERSNKRKEKPLKRKEVGVRLPCEAI